MENLRDILYKRQLALQLEQEGTARVIADGVIMALSLLTSIVWSVAACRAP